MNDTRLEEIPRVSIIIPVRNNLELTRKCLDSIAAAPPLIPYEVIVIDNASDDGSRNYLTEKACQGEINFIRNDPPMHFAVSCNQGAFLATGDYLLFLNNDTEAFPGWLDNMVMVADQSHQVGAVGAKLLYPDGTVQHAGVAFYESRFTGLSTPFHVFKDFPGTSPAVNEQREYQVVTGACLLTPGMLFHDLGGFDTTFVNCFEDVDYCLRLKELGYKVIYTPDAELIHHEGQTPGRNDNVRQAGIYLQGKWKGKLKADAVDYIKAEGFHISEGSAGRLTISFGQELMEWWRLIGQLMDLGQYQLALKELETLKREVPGTVDLYDRVGKCLLALNRHVEAQEAFSKVAYFRGKTSYKDELLPPVTHGNRAQQNLEEPQIAE